MKSFIGFLTPPGVRVLNIEKELIINEGDVLIINENYEYIITSDSLGYMRDVQSFLQKIGESLTNDGRVVITQYSALWEPILRIASKLRLRDWKIEQNWLSLPDLKNFMYLSGFETVKCGTKMIMPIYIPLISYFLNNILSNIWPFNHLGFFHYLVAKKIETSLMNKPSISIGDVKILNLAEVLIYAE